MLKVYSHPDINARLKSFFEMRKITAPSPYLTLNENLDAVEVDIYYERKGKVGNHWIYGFTHAVCESGNIVTDFLLSKSSFSEITTIIHDFDRGQYVSAHASICIPLSTFGRLYCHECMHGNFTASSGFKTRKAGKLNLGRRKDFINEIIRSYDDPTFPSIWEFEILYWKIDHYAMDYHNPYHALLGRRCEYVVDVKSKKSTTFQFPLHKISEGGDEHLGIFHNVTRMHLNPVLNYGKYLSLRFKVLSIRCENAKQNLSPLFDVYIVKITEDVAIEESIKIEVIDGKDKQTVIITNIDNCKTKRLSTGEYVTVMLNTFGEAYLIQ